MLRTPRLPDSTLSVFARASDAVRYALRLQDALAERAWPEGLNLRVRVALHAGEAQLREGDYFGQTVNRAARLRSLARGGQTVLSRATADLVTDTLPPGVRLVELGERQLRGMSRPEEVFEIAGPAACSSPPAPASPSAQAQVTDPPRCRAGGVCPAGLGGGGRAALDRR